MTESEHRRCRDAFEKAGYWPNFVMWKAWQQAWETALGSELAQEVSRLQNLISTPELNDFDKGVPLESAHQIDRWGEAHDRSKSAENWYWLVGYLAGKALRASIQGDRAKALHHTISAAAALRNWHSAIKRDTTGAGIGRDEDLAALDD